ncbi:MAG: hypothetical protein ACTXOO_02350 [Sodalis sp. (in: enterobacteria)]
MPVYKEDPVISLQVMNKVSERLGNTMLMKREDGQPVHSLQLVEER